MDFKKFYDEQADYSAFRNDPEKRREYNIIVSWKARELVKLVPPGKVFGNILEIGCAMGILLNNVADRLSIDKRFGLDISEENIKTARTLFPGTTFFRGTLEDSDIITFAGLNKSRFDLVILSDIVEHIPDDLEFMKQVKGISSYVLLNLPLEKCFRNRNRKYGEDDPSGHLRCYNREMAESLARDAGFVIINSFTANALTDKEYFDLYNRKRKARISKKPLPMKLLWSAYYNAEDQLKNFNERGYEKIYGTNYFALLKSESDI